MKNFIYLVQGLLNEKEEKVLPRRAMNCFPEDILNRMTKTKTMEGKDRCSKLQEVKCLKTTKNEFS